MSETSGGLPLMAQTQNSRYLTFNELAWALNVLQTGVLDRDLTSPPGSPSEGDAYIVGSPATGAWAGHENDIAFFFDGIWNFLNPELGQGRGIWVVDEEVVVQYGLGSPTGWEVFGGTSGDASTNTATSVDGEITLFSGTGGKTLKRATGTGFVRVASGVMSSVDGSNDDIAQRKAGVWTNRTIAQVAADLSSTIKPTESFCVACSDETTAITTGTAKVTFRMPYAFTLSAVRASVTTAPTGSTIIIDINEAGSTILSTKLSIDASEKTSTTAASAAVISDTALADDAEITIDFDQVGSTIAGAGVKVYLIGTRT